MRVFASITIALLALPVLGCGKSAPEDREPPPSARRPAPEVVAREPEFERRLKELAARDAASCHAADLEVKLEMARELDRSAERVREYVLNRKSDRYRVERFGPIDVRIVREDAPAEPPVWSHAVDWASIRANFEKAKADPSRLPELWNAYADLDTLLIAAEESGSLYDVMSREIYDRYPSIVATIGACVADPACAAPAFVAADGAALAEAPFLLHAIRTVFDAKAPGGADQRRLRWNSLEEELRPVRQWRDPMDIRRNDSVRRAGDGFEVALETGFFSGFERELADYVSSVWTSFGRSLKVRWEKGAYVFVGLDFTRRAFVSYKDRTIGIPQLVRKTTIAHEIGHVLGFRDRYFETYRSDVCRWKSESETVDIMSDPDAGRVLERHWQALEKAYLF